MTDYKTSAFKPSEIEAARPMVTVFSYYLPEVRPIIDELAASYPHQVFQANYLPGLDTLHEPVIEAFIERAISRDAVTGFDTLPYRYPTSGSSEALFHLFARKLTEEPDIPLYQLAGEYQGYQAYADSLGLKLETLDEEELLAAKPGLVILSNPSARDGNRIPAALYQAILARHRVILDLAYLGMTDPLSLDLADPQIEAVVSSLSKPFGLYYHRIGFCFSRREIPSLYGTKWFKNAFSLMLAERVLRSLDRDTILARYRALQQRALDFAADDGYCLDPAEVWLLGSKAAATEDERLEEFRRGRFYRACLTPYFIKFEQEAEVAGYQARQSVGNPGGHAFGEASDFGWRRCHACDLSTDGYGAEELCPGHGICRRQGCPIHSGLSFTSGQEKTLLAVQPTRGEW